MCERDTATREDNGDIRDGLSELHGAAPESVETLEVSPQEGGPGPQCPPQHLRAGRSQSESPSGGTFNEGAPARPMPQTVGDSPLSMSSPASIFWERGLAFLCSARLRVRPGSGSRGWDKRGGCAQ
jgi:hypothetical protein